MVSTDNLAAVAERKVSRRRLVRDSALTAGALALASQIDTKYALAQDEGPIKIGWLGDRTGEAASRQERGRQLHPDLGMDVVAAASQRQVFRPNPAPCEPCEKVEPVS